MRYQCLYQKRLAIRAGLRGCGGQTPAGQHRDMALDSVEEPEETARVVVTSGLLVARFGQKERRGLASPVHVVEQPPNPASVLALNHVPHRGVLLRGCRALGRLHEYVEVQWVASFQLGLEREVAKRVEVDDRPSHDRRCQHDANDDRRQQLPVGEAAPCDHGPRGEDADDCKHHVHRSLQRRYSNAPTVIGLPSWRGA